ncbi:MAG: hypothetical protein KDD56_08850 [Bdellovibrionales bacterium]|nr:hypothetical protein [Bdellovibrionales bacterium]
MKENDFIEQLKEMKNYISSKASCIKGVGLVSLPEEVQSFNQAIDLASKNCELFLETEEKKLLSLVKAGAFAGIIVNTLAGLKRSFKIASKFPGAVLIFASDKLINQDDTILATTDGVLRVSSLEV